MRQPRWEVDERSNRFKVYLNVQAFQHFHTSRRIIIASIQGGGGHRETLYM